RNDRDLPEFLLSAKFPGKVDSAFPARQHEVAEHDVRKQGACLIDGRFRAVCNFRPAAEDLQEIAEQLCEIAIVFDDQGIEFFWYGSLVQCIYSIGRCRFTCMARAPRQDSNAGTCGDASSRQSPHGEEWTKVMS
ncbi:MAG TPA: hypothetical protein VGE12_13780, partial [Noviherbaspirillum sp.]